MTADQGDKVISGYEIPDYAAVDVPTTKPREEFTVAERRAELFDIITQLGHPARVNQTELAERYGVSQPMIHKDLDVLAAPLEEEAEEKREKADSLRRQADIVENRPGFETWAKSMRETAAELEGDVVTLEAKLSGEGGHEAMAESTNGSRTEPSTSHVIDPQKAVEVWSLDRSEIGDRIERHQKKALDLQNKAHEHSAKTERTKVEILKAARAGKTRYTPDNADVYRFIPGGRKILKPAGGAK